MPVLAYTVLMVIYPMAYSLILAFSKWHPAAGYAEPVFAGLTNFEKMLYDTRFTDSLYNTFYILGIAIPIQTLLGMGLALLLDRVGRGRKLITGFLMVPMFVAPVLVGCTFRMMMWRQYGVLNYFLQWVPGYPHPWGFPWIASIELSKISVVMMDIWHWTPFMLLITLAGLQSVPREPVEAAMVDGASSWRIFRHITLVHIVPILLIGIVIRIADLFKIFDELYLLTLGGPGNSSEVISLYLYLTGFRMMDYGYTAALTYAALIIISIVTMFFIQRVGKELKR